MKNKFGARLRMLRGDTSQREFVREFSIKQTTYSSWERGIKEPPIETVCQIALRFGVSIDWLFGINDDRKGNAVILSDPVKDEEIKELKRKIIELEGIIQGQRYAIEAFRKGK
jgi:transcriptional regulator with XRE-family HTH domain